MSMSAAKKRPRELFPDAAEAAEAAEAALGNNDEEDALLYDAEVDGGDDEAVKVEEDKGGIPKRKRNRTKRLDEGDAKELKPRHLRGKRAAEVAAMQVANLEDASKRKKAREEEETSPAHQLQAQLMRLLRPKARRWAMYEWFHSPVDLAWFRDRAFLEVLQAAGLGHVTHLTRIEWSFLRSLVGKPRRFSAAFVQVERSRLTNYRHEVRTLRQLQLTGGNTAALEVELGVHGTLQLAVGQRVTALHPKERHLFTGTVLTPDGTHYRIQFDRQKHGVQLVRDLFVMPLLDGSRGIDFTSPHGMGLAEGGGVSPWDPSKGVGGGVMGADGLLPGGGIHPSSVQLDSKELQLVAYVLRLLERKRLLLTELKSTCAEAERELRKVASELLRRLESGEEGLHAPLSGLRPPPTKIELSAAQQRVLGQVPPPPELPSLHAVFSQLRHAGAGNADTALATALERQVAIWRHEIDWLQDELRSTARALEAALVALKPTSQRFALALGAAAPEPQSRGLGVPYVAQLRDSAGERTACVLSAALAAGDGRLPEVQLKTSLHAAVALLLETAAWSTAPLAPAECRAGLQSALKRLTPLCDANRTQFSAVMATAQQLQTILCGAGDPSAARNRQQ